MQPPKQRNEVEWIREQVYDAEDVVYATEPYAGASVIRYTWQCHVDGELLGNGIGALYGISQLHARQLFHKWNTYNRGWHYEYLEEKEVPA